MTLTLNELRWWALGAGIFPVSKWSRDFPFPRIFEIQTIVDMFEAAYRQGVLDPCDCGPVFISVPKGYSDWAGYKGGVGYGQIPPAPNASGIIWTHGRPEQWAEWIRELGLEGEACGTLEEARVAAARIAGRASRITQFMMEH